MNISLYSWSYKSWTVGGIFIIFFLHYLFISIHFPNVFFFLRFFSSCSTIWISFMDAHKTDVTSWCSRTPWRKCKSSSLCKKPERLMPKLWKSWKSPAVASQMWPITTSSTGNPCGRRKTSLTGQGIDIYIYIFTLPAQFSEEAVDWNTFWASFHAACAVFFMMGEGPSNT